jgi:3-dehydroquinate dehydratase II
VKPIFILNGPNLNLLGSRQPEIYGHTTLADIQALCADAAKVGGAVVRFHQSNAEADIIGWIHEAISDASGIIINAGALTHTSVAILDALNAFPGPVVEVHLSNIYKREAFRHHSFISARADAVIAGAGPQGYIFGIERILAMTKG